MANRCFNELYFTGSNAAVKQANLFLAGLPADKWDVVKIEGTEGYFQDLFIRESRFHFCTRWEPDLQTVKAVADRFQVGFVLQYDDPQMSLYGQASYHRGRLTDIRLGREDFTGVAYRPEKDVFQYQGQDYDNLEPLALDILAAKVRQAQPAHPKQHLKPRH
jgi:Ferredoxin-like domain in Api92-like protein